MRKVLFISLGCDKNLADSEEMLGILVENGYEITVRAGLHCSPLIHEAMGTKNSGTVRVSVSWFTKEEEILAFLEAAGQIAVSLRGAD